jgi:hypothetical protein
MRYNSGIMGPKQSVTISSAGGMFGLIEQQVYQGSGVWPLSDTQPYSVLFDGSGDYLTVSASTLLSLDADFTIECWIYLTSAPADYQMIISSSDGNAYLSIRSTQIELIGLSTVLQIGKGTLVENRWFHLAVTRSSSTVTMWLNGQSLGTGSRTGTLSLGSAVLSTYIGRWGSTPQYNFPGYISNLRVIKGTALYNATFAVPSTKPSAVSGTSLIACASSTFSDSSSNGLTITKTGDTVISATVAPLIRSSLSFNGSSDYLAINAGLPMSLTGDFTVEFYLRFSSLTSYRTPFTLASSSSGGQNYLQSTSLGGTSFSWGGWGATNLSAGTSFAIDTWYHLALCRSGSTIRSFKDGALIASGTTSATIPTSNGYIYIASQNTTQWFFGGYISNLRVLNGSAIYTAAFTPPTTDLTNISNTALLMGQWQAFQVDFSSNALAVTKGGTPSYSTTILPF